MLSVTGVPSSQELVPTTKPYRTARMTTALLSYISSWDVTTPSEIHQVQGWTWGISW